MRKAKPPPVTSYTGKPDDGGEPCSDLHHAVMFLPEGEPYDMTRARCAECGQPEGYHHRSASCGAETDPLTAHPLRVAWDPGVLRGRHDRVELSLLLASRLVGGMLALGLVNGW